MTLTQILMLAGITLVFGGGAVLMMSARLCTGRRLVAVGGVFKAVAYMISISGFPAFDSAVINWIAGLTALVGVLVLSAGLAD